MSSGAATAVKGAAAIMPADATAAVRNSASRRGIGPVICVLKMRPLAFPIGETKGDQVKPDKSTTNWLVCFVAAATYCCHRQANLSLAVSVKSRAIKLLGCSARIKPFGLY